MNLKIKYVPISELRPAPYNPRIMTDEEMDKLKLSMQEFGVVEPLIVNTVTGFVVGGNQRLEAARQMEIEELPVVEMELSEAKEKALNLALNKIHGDFVPALLKDILQELDTGEIDMGITGFSEKEIEDLMTQVHTEEQPTGRVNKCPECGYEF